MTWARRRMTCCSRAASRSAYDPYMKKVVLAGILVCAARASAFAQVSDDGYCEHAKGVAASQSAILEMPELFGAFGYIDQPAQSPAPEATTDAARLTVGVRYRLGGLYQGVLDKTAAND